MGTIGNIPIARDERLAARILNGEPDAPEAAMALMERYDPESLPEALSLIDEGRAISPPSFEIVAEAWDRYVHIRNMPWD